MHLLFVVLIALLTACSTTETVSNLKTVELCGREAKLGPLYRVKMPLNWRIAPSSPVAESDTKVAICEIDIEHPTGPVKLVIHTFPYFKDQVRIPPQAQIERWKKQFDVLDQSASHVTPLAFGGYVGQFLKAYGTKNEQAQVMLAWALQVGQEHVQALSWTNETNQIEKHLLADVTFKITGPEESINDLEDEIKAFVHSFKLIKPFKQHFY